MRWVSGENPEKKCQKNPLKIRPKPNVTILRIRLQKLVPNNLKVKKNIKVIINNVSYFTLDGNEWKSQD